MIFLAPVLAGFGLICVLYRKTLLGVLIGMQLFAAAGAILFVSAGAATGTLPQGHVFALFVIAAAIAQLVAGYALAVRLFYLKRRSGMEDVKALKH